MFKRLLSILGTITILISASQVSAHEIDLLIYNGTGVANGGADSIANIASSHNLTYKLASSSQLNEMSDADFKKYGLIVWPGGIAKTMSDSLSDETRIRIRNAITDNGVSYFGICAGAFMTGTYDWSPTWGFEMLPVDFPYYYLEDEGVSKAMVDVTLSNQSKKNLLWWGGPEIRNFGQVVGKYPDGTTAIAQDWVGKGFVILSAVHPEAPRNWRDNLHDSDGLDSDFAYELIRSALERKPLRAF